MSALAIKAAGLLKPDESSRLVGVGSSGTEFARRLNAQAASLPVRTVAFNRNRAFRILNAEGREFDAPQVLVDDVAVSGLTLERANQAIQPRAEAAVTGMLFNSKTTRRRIGIGDLRPVVTYSRRGGNNPPMNSVGTLRSCPERLDELAERYFGNLANTFAELLREKQP